MPRPEDWEIEAAFDPDLLEYRALRDEGHSHDEACRILNDRDQEDYQ